MHFINRDNNSTEFKLEEESMAKRMCMAQNINSSSSLSPQPELQLAPESSHSVVQEMPTHKEKYVGT